MGLFVGPFVGPFVRLFDSADSYLSQAVAGLRPSGSSGVSTV